MALTDCQFQKSCVVFNKYKTEFWEGRRKLRLEKEYGKSKILYLR